MSSAELSPQDEAIATRVITTLAGPHAQLREDQQEAVAALVRPAARVVVVQATGWGKSAVYWVATAILRSRGSGPTLVVSPLLSLMRDQVGAAERAGLRSATINSANRDDWDAVWSSLSADQVDVLLVSPERLADPGFGAQMLSLLAGRLGMVVIDEAHAVSDWGHDFRPDYRRVAQVLGRLNPQTPVLATTATANARVSADVAAQLGNSTLVQRGPLARTSLELVVVPGLDPLGRLAWLVQHLPLLPGSGIIYVLTKEEADRAVSVVRDAHGDRYPVAAYTGALESAERVRLEEDLRANKLTALVATSALGMGYDKPDLGFVVHLGSPPSPVSYYQQVGRAGRAIDHAVVALLPADGDEAIWEYFATATIPVPEQVERLLKAMPGPRDSPVGVVRLEAESGLRRSKVDLLLRQLAVEDVVVRRPEGWQSTGRRWVYDADHYTQLAQVRRGEAQIMRRYVRGESCLMALLQDSLDDRSAQPCGRCSVCRGGLPAGWSGSAEAPTVSRVRQVLRSRVHRWEPRKMWPGGSCGRRGRIPERSAVVEGRVLIHADAPEWTVVLRECRVAAATAAAVPEELLAAAVTALSQWRHEWPARPGLVVALDTGRLPGVAAGVAEHLGQVGRLPVMSWQWGGGVAPVQATSAVSASWWSDRLGVDTVPKMAPGEVVLLVVDASATGWSVTMAGAALRAAGAAVVLPLVIHRQV
ncbi:ATP-dependent RNA helicase RhlB [Austwickia sp. TVS 96-490-7B]|uniref:RecQ family ATP-dependent DNA helicase n=1 Tax=Austwickia sp. TVS 96-490-7B TaxID=2830843 RepID=UPI001C584B48|nr:DEAD/DEAH box helicase [Austwickia sp. TVS 96-490-7B]MBW3086268.1 ATP-dependent RNA helicase RhlB [Austwickia sp. TVS 96-490-7B]